MFGSFSYRYFIRYVFSFTSPISNGVKLEYDVVSEFSNFLTAFTKLSYNIRYNQREG